MMKSPTRETPPTKSSLGQRLLIFFSIVGPGMITANVDNDAGGLTTYSQAGALFGYDVLWMFTPIILLLIMVQEMVNRMGVVTGQGLSDAIRERFGVKTTFYLMLFLLFTNFGNVMAEFAGIAAASKMFSISPFIAVPVCAVLVWILVLKGNYKSVEKIFLFACLFYAAYPITLVLLKPNWAELGLAFVKPRIHPSRDFLSVGIGLVGTTIAPWMQFYQQASVAEKNVRVRDYFFSKLDTIVGCIIVNLVAASIVAVCALTLHPHGIRIESAGDAAASLAPFAGKLSSSLFAIGLWNASLFAACILPLSTSYTICEAMGWESGLDKSFPEARSFYILYTVLVAAGALSVLFPSVSFVKVMFWSQVVNGLLLPIVLIFILRLVNDQRLMGDWRNSRFYNAISWPAVVIMSGCGLLYVAMLLK